jgi:hypothetical protein
VGDPIEVEEGLGPELRHAAPAEVPVQRLPGAVGEDQDVARQPIRGHGSGQQAVLAVVKPEDAPAILLD